ncbi:hypothetical protein ACFL02_07345, partial [Planctomycetota bacterium]
MNHKNLVILLLLVLLVNLSNSTTLWAQQEAEGPPTVKIAFHPAPEPIPALKYPFRIEFLDQTPGNAALYYYTAVDAMQRNRFGDMLSEFTEWLELPIDELPQEKTENSLSFF